MNRYMSLKDHVYEYLAKSINNGTLTPDDKISEQQICNELNVSRTPVREALIQLCTEGYIENIPRKGFAVRHIDETKARELYVIIGCLEGMAAVLALGRISEPEISRMKFLVSAIDLALENNSIDTYYDLQIDFHNVYIDLCGNSELADMLHNLKRSFIRKSYTANDKGICKMLQEINEEHKQMVDLFENRDASALEAYIRNVHWNPSSAVFNSF